MIRIVFASCLLLIVTSCSGIAGLALTAVSTAKSTYDGYKYIDKNFSKKEVEKEDTGRQWYQVHDEGIWYGDYFLYERKKNCLQFQTCCADRTDTSNFVSDIKATY